MNEKFEIKEPDQVVVRFSGDSGDGMQLAGNIFSTVSATVGNGNTLQLKLALMGNGDGFPIALGVIRDVDAPTYDDCLQAQIQEVSSQNKYHNFSELLETNNIWVVR